ncbi:MAG TPA: NAD(P)/FAD-dependent oxidoreductase [Bacillota bacterium]|nr:NAD(P)/FAD-dependent oxidoreductase [Peptococcaceae bacterium MAG4]NLW37189.1 NAD(P)/FAD-dependent oxidoreductase [Peptococcaceae bacterium]HPU35499.1 NAD(P)/FAD-dependent oxidoreductase [Bacillota bacterium]HPZ43703.1 NAD(P)/FAD-dependent oxidoreductase [Bacillota bacterium]HUM58549.1 NAD(P)/FAD-dependent oxidoreductase [Bacillota bacterium]
MAATDLLDKGAVLQRDKETYAVVPHMPGGLVTPAALRKIADVAEKYNAAALKITSAQRLAIVGLKEEDLDNVWKDLGMKPSAAIGLCVRSIKFCPGTTFCKRGQQDSVGLGLKLDERYHGLALPGKFKMGVSGCANSCGENHFRDVGVMGTPKGFRLMVGGNGGVSPRLAQTIYDGLDEEQVLEKIDKIIKVFAENAKKHERLGRFIDRIGGIEEFKKMLEE